MSLLLGLRGTKTVCIGTQRYITEYLENEGVNILRNVHLFGAPGGVFF